MLNKIIPLETRKLIKSKVLSLSKYLNKSELIGTSKTALSKVNHQGDIINFSIISWNYRFQRPQQLVKGFENDNLRTFYIETELIPSTAKKAIIKLKKISKNIFLVNLSASKELFIYTQKPSKKDVEIFNKSFTNLIEQSSIKNPILKIDHPFWYYFLKKSKYPIIYDCMDNHKDFPYYSPDLERIERSLIKNSEHVIVTSRYLQKKINRTNKNTSLVPNAVDYSHFSKSHPIAPEDMSKMRKPIIGYYGAISSWMDEKLIKKILIEFPNSTLLLIGRVENSIISKLNSKYNNLNLLGEKKYQEIPKYLEHFDVCLIPFKITPLIKATNPVKIYEYLCKNKAVVSSWLPELEPIKELIYLSRNHKHFLKNIHTALKENVNLKRKAYSANNTWEKRSHQIIKIFKLIYSKYE